MSVFNLKFYFSLSSNPQTSSFINKNWLIHNKFYNLFYMGPKGNLNILGFSRKKIPMEES